MRVMILFSALLASSALAQPVANTIPPPSQSAQGDVAVTIYNGDLALVQDTRQLDIPAGRSRQEFPDVSAQIRPETVTLSGAGVGIVEQNFDFDLLSPQALMEKALGETLTPFDDHDGVVEIGVQIERVKLGAQVRACVVE